LASASSGLAVTQAEAQLRGLALLQRRVDGAGPASLAAIRAEVAASIAATQSFVQQMQGAGSAVTAEKAALQQASEAARGSVTDFMHSYYDEHKFDRYLQFASTEDQEEYRRREAERKQAMDKALAEHTPEGNLRANQLAIDQLKDAGAHGADKSPDYKPTLDRLNQANHELSTAIAGAQNKKTAENRAASLDPDAKSSPSAAVSLELIAQLRGAQASAAINPDNSTSLTAPAGASGGPRVR
jgi:hypothetical protein